MSARMLMSALILLVLCECLMLEAHLQVGFYENSCSMAEFIVKQEVTKAFFKDKGVTAGLVRMHFHDCFVRGCDGSVLIESTPSNKAEKDSPVNNPSLRGFEVIDSAKARLESVCQGVVSCADIIAFAARDSVEITRGFGYDVPAGRRDGRISLASETRSLPSPAFNVDQLTQNFKNKGLSQEEMVTLSGAHTIGRSHCVSFSTRLYNFSSTRSQDPNLDPAYAAQLKRQCPQGSTDSSLVVPMNPASPVVTDVSYYRDILANRGLFVSDQALLKNPKTATEVTRYVRSPFLWSSKFANAMVKMGQIGVLTGNAGEIRANCRFINS
ncbi:peroxidase 5-like [Lycium barbarum]|uniref:peroxidase 5-like n=1 Tax=Lycium barbarum TaxID=112863 RepID=UPI00293EFE1D|nr:peroxidase 5-like [Lycium barbarum]